MLRVVLCLMSLLLLASCGGKSEDVRYAPAKAAEWTSFGGAPGGGHYSPADQITPQNVHALVPAWEWRSGHARQPGPGKLGGYDVPLLPGSTWQMTGVSAEVHQREVRERLCRYDVQGCTSVAGGRKPEATIARPAVAEKRLTVQG
jgi:hypothetical protein